jgi:hypothetical protein
MTGIDWRRTRPEPLMLALSVLYVAILATVVLVNLL